MKANPTNSSNSTVMVAGQVFAITAGLCISPDLPFDFSTEREDKHKVYSLVPPMICIPNAAFIGDQFIPNMLGGSPPNEFDYVPMIDVQCAPVTEFTAYAYAESVEKGVMQAADFEDVFYLD